MKIHNKAYYSFKKRINEYNLSSKHKCLVFKEFKSTILDYRFQNIKSKMLDIIVNSDSKIFYAAYQKMAKHLKQFEKENIYCRLLNRIVTNINDDIDIIYGRFKNKKFEYKINKYILLNNNVLSIVPSDSQLTPGLQFVDNLVSTIRHHLSKDKYEKFYMLAKTIIKKV